MGDAYHTFRGKKYKIKQTRNKKILSDEDAGSCDHPKRHNKKIVISRDLTDLELLETYLHEALHAALWDLDEDAIEESSVDIARFLWRLGYRRKPGRIEICRPIDAKITKVNRRSP